jgi:hypothetical protein
MTCESTFSEKRLFSYHGSGTAFGEELKTLKLSSPVRLATPANHRFVVGEGKRADVIWSEGGFLASCEHMLNEKSPNHFLTGWIDQVTMRKASSPAAK